MFSKSTAPIDSHAFRHILALDSSLSLNYTSIIFIRQQAQSRSTAAFLDFQPLAYYNEVARNHYRKGAAHMANQFFLDLFVVDTATNAKTAVKMLPVTSKDVEQTRKGWQTYWGTAYMRRPNLTNYAMKTGAGELIGLASYELLDDRLVVHIVYMESQPESNPTLTTQKKYSGIGKAIIAYGVKLSVEHGFGGDVILEPKTPELLKHYVKDFGGLRLPNFGNGVPVSVLIADNVAVQLVADYIEKEDE